MVGNPEYQRPIYLGRLVEFTCLPSIYTYWFILVNIVFDRLS